MLCNVVLKVGVVFVFLMFLIIFGLVFFLMVGLGFVKGVKCLILSRIGILLLGFVVMVLVSIGMLLILFMFWC